MPDTFTALQDHLAQHPYLAAEHTNKQRTLVYVAGMSLDQEELAKISGVECYEERMLYVIGLLRNPRTSVIFITSKQIDPAILDYYFELFSRTDSERESMRSRWHHFFIGNSKPHKTLTQKVLSSKRIYKQVMDHMGDPKRAVLRCFNASEDERDLAVKFGIPLFAPKPDRLHWGSKSGSRKAFHMAGTKPAYGHEDLHTIDELLKAIRDIKQQRPAANKVVLKFNYSFSGVGNAVLPLAKFPRTKPAAIKFLKKQLKTCEPGLTNVQYLDKFVELGGIVEEWLEGDRVYSPSVQVKISPDGKAEILSSHEQLLDAETQQIYLGARYPARKALRPYIVEQAIKIGDTLAKEGVIGPFGIDFMVVKRKKRIYTYPVEINLRKGGTTHPFQIARMLTEGKDHVPGSMRGNNRKKVYYHSFDNIKSPDFVGLKPQELIDVVRQAGLEFDPSNNMGIALHLMGAVTKYGKFGAVCISRSPKAAEQLFVILEKVIANYVAEKNSAEENEVIEQPTVQRDRLVDSFIEMARISSPSGEEDALKIVLREQLVELGCKVRFDKFGNLIAKRPGAGPVKNQVPFLLSSHMDTVRPCDNVQPVVRGDVIMTDGKTILGADNKAGLAYIIEALRIAQEHDIELLPLEIVFTVQEETFSQGAAALNFAQLKSPYGLVVDGANVGEVDYMAPYIATFNLEIIGKTAHSGVEPENGISTVQILADAVTKLKLGRVDKETTANIGLVSAGTNRNAIPGQASIVGEVRSLKKRKLEDQLERMIKAFEDASEKHGGLLDIDSKVLVTGYTVEKTHPHIKHIMNIMREVGIEPDLRKAGGGSDSNVFINAGIMAIDVGTGVQKPHTTEEHIDINDMVQMTEFVLRMITA